ncbi:MAG: ABC transporter ATP-binding protein [Proteobacteria bacterium]|nr:ABC transporter ATP-binding protein [Desulfobacterales bacterium]MBL7102391.1 ABC transporter ATP-binding protein [Desulfobacteraceae bacterium]MBL7173608.1 ABC transporter ATP-binding protein [Desulfobacteraceae bacterium]MBU0733708.1 ABC transporter ATP-binding protein [Pseudomonadota bacterium]MBU1903443.1 ABC transporter ATP-binding protein [Pseudomonadota bacterium]
MSLPVIRFKGVKKIYPMEGEIVHALKGVDIDINPGEFVAIMGPSGSGKSTMMHIAGLLDSLSEGRYELEGENVSAISRDKRADIRNRKIGFIFQGYNLLARCNALENVELPMLYRRPGEPHRKEKAMEALKMVGMEDRASHQPKQLSGGEQQRVAIARALVNDPALILADEPTGNLDTKTGLDIIKLLGSLHEKGITIIIVTHDPDVGRATRRRIYLRDGLLESDETE